MAMPECLCRKSVLDNPNAQSERIYSSFRQACVKRQHALKFAKVGFAKSTHRILQNVVWNQLSLHPVCLILRLFCPLDPPPPHPCLPPPLTPGMVLSWLGGGPVTPFLGGGGSSIRS